MSRSPNRSRTAAIAACIATAALIVSGLALALGYTAFDEEAARPSEIGRLSDGLESVDAKASATRTALNRALRLAASVRSRIAGLRIRVRGMEDARRRIEPRVQSIGSQLALLQRRLQPILKDLRRQELVTQSVGFPP